MKNNMSSSTHGVLHILMSKAALEGSAMNATIKIPMPELMAENGSDKDVEESDGILLKIEIKTSFEQGTEDSLTIEMEGDEEEMM